MQVLFITGQNQYGVVSHFLDGMREDLESVGVRTDSLSVESEQHIHRDLPQLLPLQEYDQLISFNGMGLHLEQAELSVPQYLKQRPVWVFCVDHPMHILKRIIGLNVILLCVDEEHVSFAQLCGFNARLFPHAIGKQQLANTSMMPLEDKSNEVVFPVSYMDSGSHRQALTPYWSQIGHWVEQSRSVTRFMQFIGVLPIGNRPASLTLNEQILRLCVTVDSYLRAKQREACLHFFAQQNVNLTVIGRNSHCYQSIAPTHQYLNAMDFTDLQQKIAAARYVVHNSPGFERGLHERVIYPLALGTLVLTFETPYVNQTFPQVCLDAKQSSGQISDKEYQQRRKQAHQQIEQQHCWHHQLRKLFTSPTTSPDSNGRTR
ncbi:hypothetical protein [Bowmanella pacifica]|uniref:Uncharacterized protein n=1 Tax=Bowmanella pacifica TaxID=502051 RepID=A0A917Z3A7_9ALTE|nr:hypothetical protein [Bowmanella pacifica]GGO73830.1 hypothetical protein GCM10010982_35270 [Bowmanella pacifica]